MKGFIVSNFIITEEELAAAEAAANSSEEIQVESLQAEEQIDALLEEIGEE
jgi:hypothetical protein